MRFSGDLVGHQDRAKSSARHGGGASAEPQIVLYEPLPHPYCTEVGDGATAYGKEHNVPIMVKVGQESTQANVNQNIESLFTLGIKAFSFYPVDPAGSKGLLARLRHAGRIAVVYGAQPEEGSETQFAVATDTRKAAGLAAEKLIGFMGGHGRILNVLESMTDANTPVRMKAIESAISNHTGVQIIQTVGDVTTEQQAREKIESALVARGDEVDGIICTGYTTSVAAAMLISEHNRRPGARYIHFVGLDTDERVLEAIRNGLVDATLAQNPFGHGYISVALLDLMSKGWSSKLAYQFIDSGCFVVTKENVGTFKVNVQEMTRGIVDDLQKKIPPATPREMMSGLSLDFEEKTGTARGDTRPTRRRFRCAEIAFRAFDFDRIQAQCRPSAGGASVLTSRWSTAMLLTFFRQSAQLYPRFQPVFGLCFPHA